jgi:hypothetical protein
LDLLDTTDFDRRYGVRTLYPPFQVGETEEWCRNVFVPDLLRMIGRQMSFGDATLLWIAELYQVDDIITWNPKHFKGRTTIPVLTPTDYLSAVAV